MVSGYGVVYISTFHYVNITCLSMGLGGVSLLKGCVVLFYGIWLACNPATNCKKAQQIANYKFFF